MLHSCNLIKKRLQNWCFPVNFAKFFRTNFSQNTPWRQLLVTVEHSLNRDHLFSTYTKFSGKTNISDSPILTSTCVCVRGWETLREKCPCSELFWSAFSRIWTEHGEILRIFPYAAWMRENADQNNSEYVHFSRSEKLNFWKILSTY